MGKSNHSWSEMGLKVPQILLPRDGLNYERWAVVACDQYTSEPDYWTDVEKIVGDEPSTLRLMLPEYYLGSSQEESRAAAIRETMDRYREDGTLLTLPSGCMLVRRTSLGHTRLGLVIAVDLEAYDYQKGSTSKIRATEGTVASRIPPRLKIRRGASLEMPHIIILIDDPGRTVIEPLQDRCRESIPRSTALSGIQLVYDFDLMKNGGHITGWFVPEDELQQTREAFSALYDRASDRYGAGHELLMAMGDGNHSLATAKAAWEEIKQSLPAAEWENCPARYALCEIENVHDEGIVFAPIHRVVFGGGRMTGQQILEETVRILREQNGDACFTPVTEENAEGDRDLFAQGDEDSGQTAGLSSAEYHIPVLTGGDEKMILIKNPSSTLEVAAVQNALDELVRREGLKIDYIHGGDTVMLLTADGENAGFLLPPMDKFRLFPAVARDGALPRKTFSMGQACEKRYYIECRSLR